MRTSANIQANNSETSVVELVCSINSSRGTSVLLMTVREVKKDPHFLSELLNCSLTLYQDRFVIDGYQK